AYEQLDKQHVVSADLYYNLGVTYFRQGQLGRAIWAFERALVVAPDDEDSRLAITTACAVLGTAALLAGALLLGRMNLDRIPFAVVLPDTVAVKEGADSNFRTSFEVHGGLR